MLGLQGLGRGAVSGVREGGHKGKGDGSGEGGGEGGECARCISQAKAPHSEFM